MRFLLALALAAFMLISGCAQAPINEGMVGGRAYRGADAPALTIYEYSDFECPYCSKALPVMDELLRAYPRARLEFRHNPLTMHQDAFNAAVASVCAEKQGKFWQMHDVMFANQEKLSEPDLEGHAAGIGLDMAQYRACRSSDAAAELVREDMAEAARAGAQGTPYFVIGGSAVTGAQPASRFRAVIDNELAKKG